jgi:hypothetical protein
VNQAVAQPGLHRNGTYRKRFQSVHACDAICGKHDLLASFAFRGLLSRHPDSIDQVFNKQ